MPFSKNLTPPSERARYAAVVMHHSQTLASVGFIRSLGHFTRSTITIQ